MLFTLDLDLQTLTIGDTTSPLSVITGKRSPAAVLAVRIRQSGAIITSEIGGAFALKFTAKTKGHFDESPPLATTVDFAWDAASGEYRAVISFVNTALDALFLVDGNTANDVLSVDLDIALGWKFASLDDWAENENRVLLTLLNSVIRDSDGAPADPSDPAELVWLAGHAVLYSQAQSLDQAARVMVLNNTQPAITSLTGGTAGALDSIVTAGGAVTTGRWVAVIVSGVFQVWQLQAGTTAEDSANGIVHPDDYNASTNARIWIQIL